MGESTGGRFAVSREGDFHESPDFWGEGAGFF